MSAIWISYPVAGPRIRSRPTGPACRATAHHSLAQQRRAPSRYRNRVFAIPKFTRISSSAAPPNGVHLQANSWRCRSWMNRWPLVPAPAELASITNSKSLCVIDQHSPGLRLVITSTNPACDAGQQCHRKPQCRGHPTGDAPPRGDERYGDAHDGGHENDPRRRSRASTSRSPCPCTRTSRSSSSRATRPDHPETGQGGRRPRGSRRAAVQRRVRHGEDEPKQVNVHRYGTRRCLSALMRPGPLPPNEDGPGRRLLHRVPRPPKRASPSKPTHTAYPCIHIRHTGPESTRTSQTDYASNPRTATSRARTCASRSTARQFWNHRDA